MQTFVGETVGDLRVESLLSNGPFAQVYTAKNGVGETIALKVAQPTNSTDQSDRPTPDESQAIEVITGSVLNVLPNPRVLLHYQMSLTQSIGQEVFPTFLSSIEETDRELVGYSMEFIDGVTLRDSIAKSDATIDHVITVAEALDRLLSCAPYHGDLKPGNVILAGTTARLLDPGFFGDMESAFGDTFPMKITTPLYYPFLKPDDFFAIGLITWEVLVGRHPLKFTEYPDAEISDRFDMVVRTQEYSGQFFLSPIRKLPLPAHLMPQMEPRVQMILLKLLRLAATDQEKLDVDPGYQSMPEIVDALKEIRTLL